ncbi:MAG: TetR/AcrR family transcriptional regulator [Beijerinckiaceae bacterium]|jgi:AcrR family transcriptional regulator
MPSSTVRDDCPLKPAPVPRGEKRRQEIAAVAERVFFTHGFTDTTMQIIAAEAGASKETLYRHFGCKEALFSEIVENRANHFLERLDENLRKPGSVREVLHDLGSRLLDAMMRSDSLCLSRVVIAEVPRNPDLGRIFYEQGPERVQKRLTQYLAIAHERGELRCADPLLAARLFLGAIFSHYYIKGLVIPDRETIGQEQMQAHVDEAVAMFLARYGA